MIYQADHWDTIRQYDLLGKWDVSTPSNAFEESKDIETTNYGNAETVETPRFGSEHGEVINTSDSVMTCRPNDKKRIGTGGKRMEWDGHSEYYTIFK